MKKTLKSLLLYAGVICILYFAFKHFVTTAPTGAMSEENVLELEPYADLRTGIMMMMGQTIEPLDLRDKYDILKTANFDDGTPWPPSDKMPPNFEPDKIIEAGKNPGLGIRDLHAQGITGAGVKVAIISQPPMRAHDEYKDAIVEYKSVKSTGKDTYGTVLLSILAGKSCGTAPGVSVYYWAIANWLKDLSYEAQAIEEIIDYNKDKARNDRIRIIVTHTSADNRTKDNEPYKNTEQWKAAIEKARKTGIIVMTPDANVAGLKCPWGADADDPKSYDLFMFGPHPNARVPEALLVPTANRTTANTSIATSYTYWAHPFNATDIAYLSGIMALGLQVNPKLTEEQIYQYLRETGTPLKGGWIVNPKAFIEKAKSVK